MVLQNNKLSKILKLASEYFNSKNFYYEFNGIPEDKLSAAREVHKLSSNEKILLMIETNSKYKCSVLFLEDKISCTSRYGYTGPLELNPLKWSGINNIKLINGNYWFYCNPADLNDGFIAYPTAFIPQDDNEKSNTKYFVYVLKKIIREFDKQKNILQKHIDLLASEYNKNIDTLNYENALVYSDKLIDNYPDNYDGYYLKSNCLNKLEKYDEGLKVINFALNKFKDYEKWLEDDKYILSKMFIMKADILLNENKYYDAVVNWKRAKELIPNQNNSKNENNNLEVHSYKISDTYYSQYYHHYMNIENKLKKIILITDEFPEEQPKSFLIVLINDQTQLKFQFGHPLVNELYLAHPFKENIYYHYSDFDKLIIEEKLNELTNILECLGAKTYKVRESKKLDLQSKFKESTDLKAGLSINNIGVSASGSFDTIENNDSIINNIVSREESFSYNESLYLPDNLLWYEHEPTWQSLVQKRKKGNIIKSVFKISSKEFEFISKSDTTKAMLEFNALIYKLKGSAEMKTEEELKKQSDILIEIEVEFYPVKKFTSLEDSDIGDKVLQSKKFSDEDEYLNILKDCREDGKISEDERKILEGYKKKYNISDQRSKELEIKLLEINQLNANEIEYYEEVQFCLQEDTLISLDERRILDRLRKKLNIDEKRAIEIENNLIKK